MTPLLSFHLKSIKTILIFTVYLGLDKARSDGSQHPSRSKSSDRSVTRLNGEGPKGWFLFLIDLDNRLNMFFFELLAEIKII